MKGRPQPLVKGKLLCRFALGFRQELHKFPPKFEPLAMERRMLLLPLE